MDDHHHPHSEDDPPRHVQPSTAQSDVLQTSTPRLVTPAPSTHCGRPSPPVIINPSSETGAPAQLPSSAEALLQSSSTPPIDLPMAGDSPKPTKLSANLKQTSVSAPKFQAAATVNSPPVIAQPSETAQPSAVVTTTSTTATASHKGKARASLSRPNQRATATAPAPATTAGTPPPPSHQVVHQQQPPPSIKQPKSRRTTTTAADAFPHPDGTLYVAPASNRSTSAAPPPDSHQFIPTSPTAPTSSGYPALSSSLASQYHHKPTPMDDSEDDEVEPIDRGEALVRRRMKERQRIKKEAERRQRRADEESRSRATLNSTAVVRPSASRTRTAPSQSHVNAYHTLPVTSAEHKLSSPSLESFWPPQQQVSESFDSSSATPDDSLNIPTGSPSASRDLGTSSKPWSAFDGSELANQPSTAARSASPPRAQSTYQSFGSPSQFTTRKVAEEELAPHSPTKQARPPANETSKVAPSLPGKRIASSAQLPPDLLADFHREVDEDDDQISIYHRVNQTGTSRGRTGHMPALSVRSASITGHSDIRPSSQCSRAPSDFQRDPRSARDGDSDSDAGHFADNMEVDNRGEQTPEQDEEARSTTSTPDDEDVEYTLKDRQDAINIEHPFGLPIWKSALYKKSRSVARNAEAALHNSPTSTSVSTLTFGNILWSMVFGLWLALVFAIVAAVLFVIPWGGSKYGRVVWELAGYLIWPFGKYVEEWSEEEEEEGSQDDDNTGHAGPPPSPSDLLHNYNTGHLPRWVAVSEVDEDETDSVDRMTIRCSQERDRPDPTPAFNQSQPERSDHADSGARESKNCNTSGSTLTSDLAAILGMFKGRGRNSVEVGKRQIRVRALGRLSFWAAYYLIIAPLMLLACLLCWFFVFTIPMAKLLWVLVRHVGTEPLALHFRSPPTYIDLDQIEHDAACEATDGEAIEFGRTAAGSSEPARSAGGVRPPRLKPGQPAPKHSKKSLSASRAKGRLVSGKAKVLLCTYKALGLQYYKYTVDGVNIMFIILMPFVIFVIFDAFFLVPLKLTGFLGQLSSQGAIFVMALLSVIPLSYFIGMAVASISAQSSIGMGAVINATFGSIIEILLYGISLAEGKGELVEGSIIGSVLAGVLLMPGLSMIGGSVRRKEQKFNARSAGVTSTMLIMAIIGTLTPTLFYEIYGTFQLTCSGCPDDINKYTELAQERMWQCKSCRYEHLSPVNDSFYQTSVKGLSYYCAALLSYLIGLWFSLRTHASQIWQTPAAVGHGTDHAQHLASGTHPGPHLPLSGLQAPTEQDLSHSTNQQRMSMYVRKLPEIVRQQLLPHLRPTPSHAGRTMNVSEVLSPPLSESTAKARDPSTAQPSTDDSHDLSLPRTLTTEEVNQTLHVLQMATAGHLPSSHRNYPTGQLPSSTTGHHLMSSVKGQHHGSQVHSRNPSRSFSHAHQQAIDMPTSVPMGGHHTVVGEDHEGGGHDAPNWSRTKSTTVLLSCTLLYAVIAEILVSVVDVVLDGSGIPEKLLGITLFALVPNTTEFMNAISFAINGNIALSMEIGSAYALQVCLIQIPAMIAISSIYNSGKTISAHHAFTLVFPRWDVISIIFSVFLLTYTYIEARANYHRGTILVLSYLVLVGGFYSAPSDSLDMIDQGIKKTVEKVAEEKVILGSNYSFLYQGGFKDVIQKVIGVP